MKKVSNVIYLLVLIAIIFNPAQHLLAQELNEKMISVNYYTYPLHPLPASVKNYFVEIKGPMANDPLFKGSTGKKVSIYGLSKVMAVEQADVILTIDTEELKVISNNVLNRKESDGTFVYYNEIKYTLPMNIVLLGADKKTIVSERILADEITAKSQDFASPEEVRFMYGLGDQYRSLCILKSVELLNNWVNVNFGSVLSRGEFYLFSAKGKKINYDELNEALKTVKTIFKTDIDKKLDAARLAQLKQVSELWKSEIAKADTTNSAARINSEIYYGLHFNLAFSSLWEANFDEAKRCLDIARKSKKEFYYFNYKGNIKSLEDLLAKYETLYEINNR